MFADISKSIDPVVAACLADLSRCATKLGLRFVVVGATARDFIFRDVFGIKALRATLDIDLALWVENWSKYGEFTRRMIDTEHFAQDTHKQHRFLYKSALPVDLIPFGGLESPPRTISWPPDGSPVMSTLGFAEALEHSVKVRFAKAHEAMVYLATPPGLACMKLIAWSERPEEGSKDAQDILFMARHYGDAGNESLIFDLAANVDADADFDYEIASARLLGAPHEADRQPRYDGVDSAHP